MKYLALCLLALALSIPAVAQEDKPLSNETKALIEKAEGGDAEAQYLLGLNYGLGIGVLKDEEEEVKWYRLAADQGHAEAQQNLGVMYDNGQGVLKDFKQAVKWYRKAADRGLANAQAKLGYAYENGEGVLKDYVKAYAWYSLSAFKNEKRQESRDQLAEKMTPEQLAEAQELSQELLKQIEENNKKKAK